ncbi:MAG: hypothetical protein ABIR96_06200 [Bdellovibrionota bacterium]
MRIFLVCFLLGACGTTRITRSPQNVPSFCHPQPREIGRIWIRDKAAFERVLIKHFADPEVLKIAYAFAKPNKLYVFPAGIVYTQESGYDSKWSRRELHESFINRTQNSSSLLNALARHDLEAAERDGWVDASEALQRYAQTFAEGFPPDADQYRSLSGGVCGT